MLDNSTNISNALSIIKDALKKPNFYSPRNDVEEFLRKVKPDATVLINNNQQSRDDYSKLAEVLEIICKGYNNGGAKGAAALHDAIEAAHQKRVPEQKEFVQKSWGELNLSNSSESQQERENKIRNLLGTLNFLSDRGESLDFLCADNQSRPLRNLV